MAVLDHSTECGTASILSLRGVGVGSASCTAYDTYSKNQALRLFHGAMKTYNIVLTLSERSENVIFMIPVMAGFGMGSSSSRWYQGLQVFYLVKCSRDMRSR